MKTSSPATSTLGAWWAGYALLKRTSRRSRSSRLLLLGGTLFTRVHGRGQPVENSFALYSAPEAGAEYAVLVVIRARFWALLDRRPDRRLLLQQAGVFSEVCPCVSHAARQKMCRSADAPASIGA